MANQESHWTHTYRTTRITYQRKRTLYRTLISIPMKEREKPVLIDLPLVQLLDFPTEALVDYPAFIFQYAIPFSHRPIQAIMIWTQNEDPIFHFDVLFQSPRKRPFALSTRMPPRSILSRVFTTELLRRWWYRHRGTFSGESFSGNNVRWDCQLIPGKAGKDWDYRESVEFRYYNILAYSTPRSGKNKKVISNLRIGSYLVRTF